MRFRFFFTQSLALLLLIFIFTSSLLFAQTADFPRDTSYTLYNAFKKYVVQYPNIIPVELRHSKKVTISKNIPYKDVGYRMLSLDVFKPTSPSDSVWPAILMIHGGGWLSGDKSLLHPLAQALAEAGVIAITVEYRLSPEAPYPAGVQDVRSALSWIGKHANQYHIHPEKVSVLGTSAGGQLAALVATTWHTDFYGNPDTTVSLTALIDIDGVLAFIHPVSEEGKVAGLWLGGNQHEARETWLEASALSHVDEHTPASLFIGSQYPRFLAGRQEMIQVLDKYAIPHQTHVFENAPHSFWLFEPWFTPTKERVIEFLKTVNHQ